MISRMLNSGRMTGNNVMGPLVFLVLLGVFLAVNFLRGTFETLDFVGTFETLDFVGTFETLDALDFVETLDALDFLETLDALDFLETFGVFMVLVCVGSV